MKKYGVIFIVMFVFASCKTTWSNENKELFRQGCIEVAKEDGMSEDKAEQMCDCRLDKIMAKYPKFNDFIDNQIEVQNDPEIKKCWDDAQ